MNENLMPLNMCSAVVTLDQYLPDWTLACVEDTTTPEHRSFEHQVNFESAFSNIPLVHAGISGFDIDNDDTSRLSVRVKDITNEGFKIAIRTWMHTRVYSVEVSWIALGSASSW